jgi:hypothetical protein
MNIPILPWATIHPAALGQAASMVRWAKVTPRAHGALRYQCPVTGSFVLITDETALAGLAQSRGRLRCMDCGEMHLLTQNSNDSLSEQNGEAGLPEQEKSNEPPLTRR